MSKKVTKIKAEKDEKRLDKIEELQDQLEEELEAEDERSLELAKLGAEKLKGGAGGFMRFIREQNVVGLAVGLVIGTAAGNLVKSLIDNVIMPPLGFLLGSADGLKGLELNMGPTPTGEVAILHYGAFINDFINFLVLAFCIYIVIKLLRLDIKK